MIKVIFHPQLESEKLVTAIGNFQNTSLWTPGDSDTINVQDSIAHTTGTNALRFDKANTAANSINAFVDQILPEPIDITRFLPNGNIECSFLIPNKVNVDFVFIRVGTDASNFNKWRVIDTNIVNDTWVTLSQPIREPIFDASTGGNGWDPSAILYVGVGVRFDSELDTLANIKFDNIHIVGA